MILINCLICNKEFKTYPSLIKWGKKYCSMNCRNIAIRENWRKNYYILRSRAVKNLGGYIEGRYKGVDSPNWRGGETFNKKEYNKKQCKKYYYKNNKICRKKQQIWRRNNKDELNNKRKEIRHKFGISKKYNSEDNISYTKEYKQMQRHKRRALEFNGGELSIKTVQIVYEENIKQYGTLTCYLCLQPIPFGKDHLEHRIPLSRGGTNARENLDIACQNCNCRKKSKTVEEFLVSRKEGSKLCL